MSLTESLKGVPQANAAAVIKAYANSIYDQAHRILRDLGNLDSLELKHSQEELEALQIDAAELLHFNLVSGHELAKMQMVQNIYLPRERVIKRFIERHKNNRLTN